MNTAELLSYVAPGSEWTLTGEPTSAAEYKDALVWLSEGTAPTWAALQKAKPQAEYEANVSSVNEQRRAAYVIESDPLAFKYQETELAEDKAAWLAKKAEIQARYPEPAAPGA